MTVICVGRAELPGSTSAEPFDGAAHGTHVSFRLNHTSPGSGTALHTHPYEETFIIQEGTVTFQVAQQTLRAGPGDILIVPAHTPHKFTNTGSSTLHKISIHRVATMITDWPEQP
jgi:quercetin dioxygenase-like cupin family protein